MKQAAVIGASKGIGRAIAQQLGRLGYKVHLAARSTDLLTQVKEEIIHEQGSAEIHKLDVTIKKDRETFIQEVEQLDLFIYNSGVLENPKKNLGQKSESEIRKIIDVNLTAPLLLLSELEASGKPPKCSILIGSHVAFENRSFPHQTIYSATKAALHRIAGQRTLGEKKPTICLSPTRVKSENASNTFSEANWSDAPTPEEFVKEYMNELLKEPRKFIEKHSYSVVASTETNELLTRTDFETNY